MIYPLVIFPNEVLLKKAEAIPQHYIDQWNNHLASHVLLETTTRDMIESMESHGGVGLAAPQVGDPIRFFVAKMTNEEIIAIANPEIEVPEDAKPIACLEGCLSLPGIRAEVVRPDKVILRGWTGNNSDPLHNGTRIERVLSGMDARVVQHEYDHLDGILFIQRLSMKDLSKLMSLIKDLKAGK